jgi:hypothetical protein
VTRHLEHCSEYARLEVASDHLKGRATQAQLIEANRILCRPNDRIFDDVAALAIYLFAEVVEGNARWMTAREPDSSQDCGWMMQLRILASKLARKRIGDPRVVP